MTRFAIITLGEPPWIVKVVIETADGLDIHEQTAEASKHETAYQKAQGNTTLETGIHGYTYYDIEVGEYDDTTKDRVAQAIADLPLPRPEQTETMPGTGSAEKDRIRAEFDANVPDAARRAKITELALVMAEGDPDEEAVFLEFLQYYGDPENAAEVDADLAFMIDDD